MSTRSTDEHEADYRTVYEVADGESPTEAVVDAIASVEGISPIEIDPLYDTIDPEALDRLLGHRTDTSADLVVTFTYEGWTVSVRDDGWLTIHEAHS